MTGVTKGARQRQQGVSSRLRMGEGKRSVWRSPQGIDVDLPLILDYVEIDNSGSERYRIEATIDLVAHEPAVTNMSLNSAIGLDIVQLQRDFRWASPLEAVTRLVPMLIERGVDPFDEDFPLTGYPEVTRRGMVERRRLTDEFLQDIARDYLVTGRGYARVLAQKYSVSERTVVSWVERARARGFLTSVPRGAYGGSLGSGITSGSDRSTEQQ